MSPDVPGRVWFRAAGTAGPVCAGCLCPVTRLHARPVAVTLTPSFFAETARLNSE